ncbi:MAG: PAS domain S-box protein [candidate division Zixibacteria bacterium]
MMNLTLRTKIIALVVSIVTVSLSFLIILTYVHLSDRLHQNLEEKAISISAMVSKNVGPGLDFQDSIYVAEIASGVFEDQDVRAVVIYDDNDDHYYSHISDTNLIRLAQGCNHPDTPAIEHDNEYCIIKYPITYKNAKVGCLWLAITGENMMGKVASSFLFIIGGAFIILTLSFFIGFGISSKIVKPIKIFEKAACLISSGNMRTQIELNELDKDFMPLGMAFNDMQGVLGKAFDDLNKSRDLLEYQVKERTKELTSELLERKRAEEELSKSKQKLMLHVQQTPLGVIEWDLDFCVTEWNKSAETIFGYSREEAIGCHPKDIILPEYEIPQLDTIWENLLGQKGGNRSTNDNSHKDGRILKCEWYNTPLVNEDGDVIGIASLVQDVTEQHRTLTALKEGEELLRATLESTADGILVVNNKGSVTHANTRFADMWHIPPDLFESRDDEKLLTHVLEQLENPDEFLTKVQELYKSDLEAKDTIGFKDGRVFERFTCPLVQDAMVTGRVWSFRDITDKKREEEQRQRLQEQLERAERMESLGILAGGVAHDLNNMLGPVVGYAELILAGLDEESKVGKRVKKIGKSAQDAANVIQDLLTLARRGRYELTAININEVIESYQDSPSYLKLCQTNPNVNIDLNLDPDLPNINGSSPHLLKAVMNLIVNAFDAMPEGGGLTISSGKENIDVLIDGYKVEEPGEYIVVCVSDTGMGIAEEDIGKIFEPYYSKKKMGTSGSGLGLSVVYGVVKDHGGYYDIVSRIGKGTKFILYFPVTDEPTENKYEADMNISGTETVLIVDDVEEQRDIAGEMLSSLGYKVATAENGTEAISILKGRKFDIIIIDMIMEKNLDGLDTYRKILEIKQGQKAIIVSGYSATERVTEMQKLGAGKYVKKPYSRKAIGMALRNELDKKSESIKV